MASDLTAAADDEDVPQSALDLPGVLLVVGIAAFVTALVMFTGQPSLYWYLYLVPITLAAMRLGVAGTVITWAAIVGVLAIATPYEALRQHWHAYLLCMLAFLASGLLVSTHIDSLRSRVVALEARSPDDPVTGVLKRDHFLAAAASEMERANRYMYPLGLVVLRVRGFDELKRVFGHYKTIAMLEHLAHVIRLSVRSTDPIGRLGTDEFAVVLPYANPLDAESVGRRLEDIVSATTFEGDALQPVVTCSVAVGAASYPADAEDAVTLVELARKRLADEGGGRRS